jgi:hypothetical protein
MTAEFLSDDWFKAVDEFFTEDGKPEIPEKLKDVVLNINAMDGDRVTEVTYRGCYFEPGHSDDAGAILTTPRELCYQVFIEKKMVLGVRALATGAAKLKGDRTKMMAIRAAKPTPSQATFEARIKKLTVI